MPRDPRPGSRSSSCLGGPMRGHGVGGGIEIDHAVGDPEDARELMGDDDEAHAERPPEVEDQVVQAMRGDRVEPGRRLVEEQDRRVQSHRARDRGPLGHAAADRRRQEVLEAGEARPGPACRRRRPQRRASRGRYRARAAWRRSRPASSRSTRPRPDTSCRTAGSAPRCSPGSAAQKSCPSIRTVPASGGRRPVKTREQRALAAAAAADHAEHLARRDREGQVVLQHAGAVAVGQALDREPGRLRGCRGHGRSR